MSNTKFSLNKNNKIGWEEICNSDKSISVFMYPLWLDAVCNSWSVNTLSDHTGKIIGAIVYHHKTKYGIKIILNPNMTPYHGIWINDIATSYEKNTITSKKEITSLLISSLPDASYINLRLHPDVTDTQIFKWDGYDAKVRYTYRLNHPIHIETAWKNLEQKKRNGISKAKSDLIFEAYEDISKHHNLVMDSFKRAGVIHDVDVEVYHKMYHNLHSKKLSKLFCVKDSNGLVHASLLLIQDHSTAYLISHGTILEPHRGATSLLLWQSIVYAAEQNISLDFEGSDLKRIESFYRDFGGNLTPYYQVIKVKNRLFKAFLSLLNKV